jgi:hypothetical protein
MIRVFPARIPTSHHPQNMSDEYASSGFQGSLVNPCAWDAYTPVLGRVKYLLYCVAINDVLPPREGETYPPSSDYATKNYPPPGDSTYFFCNV